MGNVAPPTEETHPHEKQMRNEETAEMASIKTSITQLKIVIIRPVILLLKITGRIITIFIIFNRR